MEKILEVRQHNKSLLRDVIRKQDTFEDKLNEISKSIESLKEEKAALDNVKGKGKPKMLDIFYRVYLFLYYFIVYYFFFKRNYI